MHPHRNRSLTFEELDDRRLLSATPAATLDPLVNDTASAVGQALVSSKSYAWTDADLAAATAAALRDPAFGQLSTLTSAAAATQQHLQADAQQETALVENVHTLRTSLADAQAALQPHATAVTTLSQSITSCTQQITALQSELNALGNTYWTLKKEQAAIPAQLTQLQTEIASLQPQVDDLNAQIATYQANIPLLQQQVTAASVYDHTLAKQVDQNPRNGTLRKQWDAACQRTGDLQYQLDKTRTKLTTAQTTLLTVQQQLTTDSAQLSQLLTRQAALPGEISAVTARGIADTNALQTAQDTLATAEATLPIEQDAVASLQPRVTESTAAVDQAQRALDALLAHEASETQALSYLDMIVSDAVASLLQNPDQPVSRDVVQPLYLDHATTDGTRMTVDLPILGGTATLAAWQGQSAAPAIVQPASASALQQALQAGTITTEQVAASPTLKGLLQLADGCIVKADRTAANSTYITSPTFGILALVTNRDTRLDPRLQTQRAVTVGDGIVTSSVATVNSNGQVTCSDRGLGPMELTFGSAQYVQWIEVAHLGGPAGATLSVTRADGTTVQIPVGESGPILVNASVKTMTLMPTLSYAAYGVRSLNMAQPVTAPSAAATHGWLQSTGSATSVDLGNANRCVRDVTLHAVSDRPRNIVTAVAYCGEKIVATQTVGADGAVHLSRDEGITAVVLQQSDPAATLFLSEVNADAWRDEAQPTAAPVGTATNYSVAQASAPVWESGKTFDVRAVRTQGNVSCPSPGDPRTVSGSRLVSSNYDNNTTEYSRHDVLSATGIKIENVQYLNESGVHLLPQEFWMRVSANSIITFPGSPRYLVYGLVGTGSYDIAENAVARHALSDVLPASGVHATSSTVLIRGIGPREGWGEVPASVTSRSYTPVGGDAVNVLFEVDNEGSGSGAIRVRVHSGPTGTASDPLIKEFTTQVSGLSRQTLSANAPIAREGDFVTLEIIGPDGTASVQTQKMHLPVEQGSSSFGGSVSHATQVLQQRIVDAVLGSNQLQAYRGALTGTASPGGSSSARLAADMVAAAYARVSPDTIAVTDQAKEQIVAVLAMNNVDTNTILTAIQGFKNLDLGDIGNAGRSGSESILMNRDSSTTVTFTLDQDSMVNFWVDAAPVNILSADIALQLAGSGLMQPFTSNRGPTSGESISSALPKGTYTLTIRNSSLFSAMQSALSGTPLPVALGMDIQPYHSQKITGRISIAERDVTMPVSMSLAEFDPSTGLRLQMAKNSLDPSKPVWVVIHGRGANENSSELQDLERQIAESGAQVVTVDWRQGAADNTTPIGLQGEQWIESVGRWVSNQLQAAGFKTQNICVVGHSWGAYVAYEIGKHTPGGVQALVALDPAADSVILGGGRYKDYGDPQFSFAAVSANSYAFHSSAFGDASHALTAKESFNLITPADYKGSSWDTIKDSLFLSQQYASAALVGAAEEVVDAYNEHGFAISLFSSLLRKQRQVPQDDVAKRFSLDALRLGVTQIAERAGNYEGIFAVQPTLTTMQSGSDMGSNKWLVTDFDFFSQDLQGSVILGN